MHPDFFDIYRNGLAGELGVLDLTAALRHLANHEAAFLPDEVVIDAYLGRITAEQGWDRTPAAASAIVRLMRAYLQRNPFSPVALDFFGAGEANSPLHGLRNAVREADTDPERLRAAGEMHPECDARKLRSTCQGLLRANPYNIGAAHMLLQADFRIGVRPGEWQRVFNCPRAAKPQWLGALFRHHAGTRDWERAAQLWEALPESLRDAEANLNLAAETFRALSDAERAVALYDRSLEVAPEQSGHIPVRLRRNELAAPFRVRPELIGQRRVAVCVYTWNKAELLRETLASLAQSDLGPARIKVLLNGCSDDSRAVADAAVVDFPHNDVEIIELPINVGAPAARNWLAALPDVQAGDYMAYLDDDVTVQPDWLAHFLTVAESDPRIGVVGCKVLCPGEPPLYQYLYRHVSVAQPGLFKLSLNAPYRQYDTGVYDVVRRTYNVMGCQHLLRMEAMRDAPHFDLRFSPSQMDDIEHDLQLGLRGWKVMYTGLVTCVHHQGSGVGVRTNADLARMGNVLGNDVKLFYKHTTDMEALAAMDNLSLDLPA